MQRCVIIGAGPVEPKQRKLLLPGDYVIACDAGYQNARTLGITPDLIVGDFDSAPRPQQGNLVVLPAEKDDTDTHYAARLAVEKGFRQALLLGVLGGARMDHSLAAIAAGLWLAKQGAEVTIAGRGAVLRYVLPGRPERVEYDPKAYFSLFPLEGAAEGVCITGAKYPLQNARLVPDATLGASNETLPGGAEVQLKQGSLLLVCAPK